MDRDLLAAWIATELDALLGEAGIVATDTPDGLVPILDTVERLAVDIGEGWLLPLARYVALDRIVTRLAVNMNVSIRGDSYQRQQQFANAKALRDVAYGAVAWIVDPVAPGTSDGPGTVTTIEMPFLTGGDEWW